jgi:HlyD family secretion protein
MNEQLVTKPAMRSVSSPASPGAPPLGWRWIGDHRRWLAIPALLVLLAVTGTLWWSLARAPAVHYSTVIATRGDIVRAVTATGTVNPELTIIVGSYVSGVIQSLSCDYNTKVTAKQVCAKIDPRPYQSLVNQAKANLDVATAQLEKDKSNLAYTKISDERYQWLVARDSTSKDTADLARNAHNQALALVGLDQATIEQRQAELDAANINLGYADIVSPVDGTVVSRNVTQGQTVAASFQTPTLFLIATDLTNMQVDTNVSESDIGGVKEGNKATFTVDAYPARIFEGTVTQLRQSPQTVQNVVTYDAVVGVSNLDLALKPGLTASTRIIVDQRSNVLRVPNQALRYLPGGVAGASTSQTGTPPNMSAAAAKVFHVWVLREDKPVSLVVVPGLDDDNFTEIVSGDLKVDDQVIVAAGSDTSPNQATAPPRL